MRVILFSAILFFSSIANLYAQVGFHGHLGVGEVHSAHSLDHMQVLVGLSNRIYASNQIFNNQEFEFKGEKYPVKDFVATSSYLTAVVGLGGNVEASLGLPYYYDYMSFARFETSGIGDVRAKLKVRLSRSQAPKTLEFALIAQGFGGTASNEEGLVPRDIVYYNNSNTLTPFGRHQIYFNTAGAMTLDLAATQLGWPLQWHVHSGYTFPVADYPGVIELGTALDLAMNENWHLTTDVFHKSREDIFGTSDQFDTEYMVAGANVVFKTNKNVQLSVGMSRDIFQGGFQQIQDGKTSFQVHPERDWTVRASLHGSFFMVPQDQDKDGVVDSEDKCVLAAEDKDGFEDADGCPEFDNDQDGILDADDSCPLLKEDKDGYQDRDGCPELDNDQDGLLDTQDHCPDDAEDKDGFEDADGCPDIDNDQDNVLDVVDECPRVPEDRDQYLDKDGCPDLDNDNDGINDAQDKCPNVAENFNQFEDFDGCPEIASDLKAPEVIENKKVLKNVRFKLGTSKFTFDSFQELDELAQDILSQPKSKFEIRVYTDNREKLAESILLTKKQGLAIRSYLMSQGVSGSRLTVTPMGSQDPIASNRSAKGRSKNRRVVIIPR